MKQSTWPTVYVQEMHRKEKTIILIADWFAIIVNIL